ncbi:MAG: amidohydrolase family protein [Bosea sp. (in: a-proteobacteria)]
MPSLSSSSRRQFLAGVAAVASAPAFPVLAQAPAMVIDTHAHVFRRGLPLAPGARYTSDYDATPADYLAQLDANGMTHGVLVQISFLGTDNSYMLEAMDASKGRLKGVVVVDPAISRDDMKAMNARGVVGVRLNLVGRPIPDFTTGPWPEHLKAVADLGWQVEIHREAKDLEGIVGPLLKAGVTVVVDHFGRPDGVSGLDDPGFKFLLGQGSSRRLWVKVSAAYRNGKEGAGEAAALKAYPMLRDALGADRLLFGSDWPHTAFEKTVNYANQRAFFQTMVTSAEERSMILGKNAKALFKF